MTQTEIEKLVKKQRDFFNSGETLNVSFRKCTRETESMYYKI